MLAPTPTPSAVVARQSDQVPGATIEPSRLSALYRLGLLGVTAALLLLPLAYLGLIALAAYGAFWHATHNTWIVTGSGASLWRLASYVAPIVAGVILVGFMLKPLAARPARREEPLSLEPEQEPRLFDFIEQVARLVGAPTPSRVHVDCAVNTMAGFRSGLLANDLVLTIGLPVVAGLTTTQFGGVLAHEFGHFAQGSAMRLAYIVRSVNAWFARVVYERDTWDERLERWSQDSNGWIVLVLMLSLLAVWLSRHVLYALMVAGHAISCLMLRQMELDADSYEAKVGGSKNFAETTERMRLVAAAQVIVTEEFSRGSDGHYLPDDLPRYVERRSRQLPEDVAKQIEQSAAERRTGIFDTHPADVDRVRAAARLAAPGVLTDDQPATSLFSDFASLARAVTRRHYATLTALADRQIVDTGVALEQSQVHDALRHALQAVFHGAITPLRPALLQLEALPTATEAEASTIVQELREARAAIEVSTARASQAYETLSATMEEDHRLTLALGLLEAGVRLDARQFGLQDDIPQAARDALAAIEARRQQLAAVLDPFEATLRKRAVAALRLTELASIRERVADGSDLCSGVPAMLEGIAAINRALPVLAASRPALEAARLLADVDRNAVEATLDVDRALGSARRELERAAAALKAALATVRSPETDRRRSLAEWVFETDGGRASGPVEDQFSRAFDRVMELHWRTYAHLARRVLAVEAVLDAPASAEVEV